LAHTLPWTTVTMW